MTHFYNLAFLIYSFHRPGLLRKTRWISQQYFWNLSHETLCKEAFPLTYNTAQCCIKCRLTLHLSQEQLSVKLFRMHLIMELFEPPKKPFLYVCIVYMYVLMCVWVHTLAMYRPGDNFRYCSSGAMCSWRFVCTCAYMHLVLHAHKHLYMHRPETNTVLSHSPPYTFWDRDSHWTWSSSIHPVWLSSKVWGLLTPPPPQCCSSLTHFSPYHALHGPLSSSVSNFR